MDLVACLRAFPLLSKISDGDLKILAGLLKTGKTMAGQDIITEGDTGSEMYILVSGTVDVIKTTVFGDKFVVATLNAENHCVFGEMLGADKFIFVEADKELLLLKAGEDEQMKKFITDWFEKYTPPIE